MGRFDGFFADASAAAQQDAGLAVAVGDTVNVHGHTIQDCASGLMGSAIRYRPIPCKYSPPFLAETAYLPITQYMGSRYGQQSG